MRFTTIRLITMYALVLATAGCASPQSGKSLDRNDQAKVNFIKIDPVEEKIGNHVKEIEPAVMIDSLIDGPPFKIVPAHLCNTGAELSKGDNCLTKAEKAIIYVHGFNNTFDDAVSTAATLKHRFQFDGPVFAISWPSKGQITGYSYDANVASWAAMSLRDNLDKIFNAGSANTQFYIIAHSMGGKITMDALLQSMSWRINKELKKRVRLIFADPDIDYHSYRKFENQLEDTQSTVYASYDLALWISAEIWGAKRAGDASSWYDSSSPKPKSDIIGIRVNFYQAAVESTFGHNYFSNAIFLDDVYDVINGCKPLQRKLAGRLAFDEKMEWSDSIYWLVMNLDEVSASRRDKCKSHQGLAEGLAELDRYTAKIRAKGSSPSTIDGELHEVDQVAQELRSLVKGDSAEASQAWEMAKRLEKRTELPKRVRELKLEFADHLSQEIGRSPDFARRLGAEVVEEIRKVVGETRMGQGQSTSQRGGL